MAAKINTDSGSRFTSPPFDAGSMKSHQVHKKGSSQFERHQGVTALYPIFEEDEEDKGKVFEVVSGAFHREIKHTILTTGRSSKIKEVGSNLMVRDLVVIGKNIVCTSLKPDESGDVFYLGRFERVGFLTGKTSRCFTFKHLQQTSQSQQSFRPNLVGISGNTASVWDLKKAPSSGPVYSLEEETFVATSGFLSDVEEVGDGLIAISTQKTIQTSASIEIWDIRTKNENGDLTPSRKWAFRHDSRMRGPNGPIHSSITIKHIRNGMLASRYTDGFIKLWNPLEGQLITDWKINTLPGTSQIRGYGRLASLVGITPIGERFAIGGAAYSSHTTRAPVHGIDCFGHRELFPPVGKKNGTNPAVLIDRCTCLTASIINDHEYIIAGITSYEERNPTGINLSRIRVFSATDGGHIQSLGAETKRVFYHFLVVTANQLISGDNEGRIRTWNISSKAILSKRKRGASPKRSRKGKGASASTAAR